MDGFNILLSEIMVVSEVGIRQNGGYHSIAIIYQVIVIKKEITDF